MQNLTKLELKNIASEWSENLENGQLPLALLVALAVIEIPDLYVSNTFIADLLTRARKRAPKLVDQMAIDEIEAIVAAWNDLHASSLVWDDGNAPTVFCSACKKPMKLKLKHNADGHPHIVAVNCCAEI